MACSALASATRTALPENVPVDRFRIAVVSTPRSGNTWLRHLLASAYGIPDLAVHSPIDLNWDALPEACVLQIHWHPVESFLYRLKDHQFRVIVVTRHPLDVLLSILHFSLHEPTARWLQGEDGNERSIFGAMPRSTAFLEYARSKRAEALLSVSREWQGYPGAILVQYEVLNRDPDGELRRILAECGGNPRKSVEEAVQLNTLPRMRAGYWRHEQHMWLGRPGLWKVLLTDVEARLLADHYVPHYADVDYDWDADPNLTPATADAKWIQLMWEELTERLHNLANARKDLHVARQELHAARTELQTAQENLELTRRAFAEVRASAEQTTATLRDSLAQFAAQQSILSATEEELARTREQLVPYLKVGPLAFYIAQRIRRLAVRYPGPAQAVKRLLGFRVCLQSDAVGR